MNKIVYHWWYAFGPFEEGEPNMPHMGQVLKYYREKMGYSKEELAAKLGCTLRYVHMLESIKNTSMPESLSRRKALAQLLGIPLILLIGVDDTTVQQVTDTFSSVSIHNMEMYERMLSLCWGGCYSSGYQRARGDAAFCLRLLNSAAKQFSGTRLNEINAMRSRFYSLSGSIARDRLDFKQAIAHGTRAIDLALELENAELIAASYTIRADTYQTKKNYKQAAQDAKKALSYADRSRPVLQGNIYLTASMNYTLAYGNKTETQVNGFLERVGKLVRKGSLESDSSYLKLNTAGFHIEQAKVSTLRGKFQDAHNSYNIAYKHLSPDLTSWQANILLEEAQTYLSENELEGSGERLLQALPVVRNLNSRNRIERIAGMTQAIKEQTPNNVVVYRLEKALQKT